MAVLLVDQVPPGVALVALILDPAHIVAGLVMAATAGIGLKDIITVVLALAHGPAGSFVVSLSVTGRVALATGVYVTIAGFAVCKVLLKAPPPETIDQAPVVAPPPIPAPDKVIGVGVADWHTVIGAPAVTVAGTFTVTVIVAVFVHPLAEVPVTV
jgi:hypothetical protein